MTPAGKGKIGDRVELVQKWTGHLKEISKQLISRPFDNQRRQVVENIESLFAGPGDYLVDGTAEEVKTTLGIDGNNSYPVNFRKNRRVRGKTQIDAFSSIRQCLTDERLGKMRIILKSVHPPHNIVAEKEIMNCLIESGYAAGHFSCFRHGGNLCR